MPEILLDLIEQSPYKPNYRTVMIFSKDLSQCSLDVHIHADLVSPDFCKRRTSRVEK